MMGIRSKSNLGKGQTVQPLPAHQLKGGWQALEEALANDLIACVPDCECLGIQGFQVGVHF